MERKTRIKSKRLDQEEEQEKKPSNQIDINLSEDRDERLKEVTDEADIVRNYTNVYGKKEDGLNENIIYSNLGEDPQKAEFVRKQHLTAKKTYRWILGTNKKNWKVREKWAELARDLIMTEIEDLAILHRNKKDNFIISGLLKRGLGRSGDEDIMDTTPGMPSKGKKAVKSFLAKDKPVKENEGQM